MLCVKEPEENLPQNLIHTSFDEEKKVDTIITNEELRTKVAYMHVLYV